VPCPYLLHTGFAVDMVASGGTIATSLLTGALLGGRESESFGPKWAYRLARGSDPDSSLALSREVRQTRRDVNPCKC